MNTINSDIQSLLNNEDLEYSVSSSICSDYVYSPYTHFKIFGRGQLGYFCTGFGQQTGLPKEVD